MKTNFKNLIFLVALILSATITSCKKEDIEPEPVNPIVVLPTVTTTAASAITQTTATTGGNITNNGNGTITASGICYSTTQNPTITNSKVTSTTTSGAFTSNITGLTANTTYYVRAYATNSAGTAYGLIIEFKTLMIPTITTKDTSNVMSTSAISGGIISSNGGSTITASGICWSTSANPTIDLTTKTTDGNTSYFSSNMTNLTPNTTYYVRAYATNNAGTAYGNTITFKTKIKIGDIYQGGIVFYLDGNGHGLIAATSDQSASIQWNDNLTTVAGAYDIAIGTGKSNTNKINVVISGTFAARVCTNYNGGGYTDWYLPSKNELDLIYTNLKLNKLGNLSGTYWSSTETGNATAWVQLFTANYGFPVGTQTEFGKTQFHSVRAIRSF